MRMEDLIKEKLQKEFNPEFLEVQNDSAKHHGHAGDDGSGQTHFMVVIVCNLFEEKNRQQRHRLVLDCLKPQFKRGLHALSIKALTKKEFENYKL